MEKNKPGKGERKGLRSRVELAILYKMVEKAPQRRQHPSKALTTRVPEESTSQVETPEAAKAPSGSSHVAEGERGGGQSGNRGWR